MLREYCFKQKAFDTEPIERTKPKTKDIFVTVFIQTPL